MNTFYWFFVGIIVFSVIFLFYKKGGYPKSLKSYSLWNIFRKLFSLMALFGVCYGIYFLVCYFWPTPEHLAFRELANNLAEKETKPYADRLKELAVKAKEEGLSAEEKREAEKISKKTENIRKNYSQGKLTPPPPKTSAKPKKEVWIFEWRATDELMGENPHQKPSSEYIANDVTYSEKELSFVCFKGSKKADKIVLTRNDQKENYMGYLFNKEKKEYAPIWLFPENGNFKGYIFANNGAKILATLKRQNQ